MQEFIRKECRLRANKLIEYDKHILLRNIASCRSARNLKRCALCVSIVPSCKVCNTTAVNYYQTTETLNVLLSITRQPNVDVMKFTDGRQMSLAKKLHGLTFAGYGVKCTIAPAAMAVTAPVTQGFQSTATSSLTSRRCLAAAVNRRRAVISTIVKHTSCRVERSVERTNLRWKHSGMDRSMSLERCRMTSPENAK